MLFSQLSDFGQYLNTGLHETAFFIRADIQQQIRISAVDRVQQRNDLPGRLGASPFFPEPFVFQAPAGFTGRLVVRREVPHFLHGNVQVRCALLGPTPPVGTGQNVRTRRAEEPLRLFGRQNGRVQRVIPDVKDVRVLVDQFGDLLLLKRDLLFERMRGRVAFRRQDFVFRRVAESRMERDRPWYSCRT